MDNNNGQKSNVLQFPISHAPDDYFISMHITNMFQTFGEDRVRSAFKELFQSQTETPVELSTAVGDILGMGGE